MSAADQVCRICGFENSEAARFCSGCGTHLATEADAVTQGLTPLLAIPGDGRPDVELVITSGHRAGNRFGVVGPRISVGRHPDSDVFLDDVTVSRHHVELLEGPTGYALRDVGSLNGTYVNGERISEEVVLASGDELQVGKFRLLYIVSSVGL
ncbi:MAG TPA: hypothetical protein DEP69_02040 [Acidimicrobiaceae bacterium]|nr:hypothetical protein [Acidimicrobiaceae bacterium]